MTKILVIEDETSIRSNIQQILELADFESITADDGLQGVEIAKKHLPDLIICDIMMPQMDGYSVIQALREDSDTATIPFIFLTAKVNKTDIRQGMNLGADDYLMKPFTPEELLDAVNIRLEKKAQLTESFQEQIINIKSEADYYKLHDNITGLPTELVFQEQFYQWQKVAKKSQQFLPIWLVGFSQLHSINSIFSPVIGNSLIKNIAQRFTDYFSADFLQTLALISYLGGERFIFLGKPNSDFSQLNIIAKKIIDAFSSSFTINNNEIFLRPSIGISFSETGEEKLETLLVQADVALKKVEVRGGNNYQLYHPNMDVQSQRKFTLENDLYRAIEKKQFELYYQPQIDILHGKIVGVEALIRWTHHQFGLIFPNEFISLAEKNGLINNIDQWVIYQSCEQLKQWNNLGINNLKVSVNISSSQFLEPYFTHKIKAIIQEIKIPPSCLELEVTESVLINNLEQAKEVMFQLKELGIKWAIDDFGTGYSSFNYLVNLPFDTLKIDRSLISSLAKNPDNIIIIKGIINMAKDLKLNLVAEGIETKQELNLLKQEKCLLAQGYLFSHPLTASEFITFFDFVSSISLNAADGYQGFWSNYYQGQISFTK